MRIAFKDDVRLALTTLGRAKWRSGLTMLGVIIGVLSVILVVSIGEGARRQVVQQIGHLGKDALLVTAADSDDPESALATGTYAGVLQASDVAVLQNLKQVKESAPLARVHSPVTIDGHDKKAAVWATNGSFADLYGKKLRYGSFFADDTSINGAVLGSQAAVDLFGQEAPLGQSFSVLGQNFVVFGVLDETTAVTWSGGVDFNSSVLLPYSVVFDATKKTLQPSQIIVKTTSPDATEVAPTIRSELSKSHGGQQDFAVLTQKEAEAGTGALFSSLTIAVIGIAIVSLVVGGIGIMNVMFVSITERMQEIGLRKAIGATNRQILRQFLTEALVVSFIGGVIGAALAIITCVLLQFYSSLDPVIDAKVVVLALLGTVVLGGFFGTIPALKAARKDPIDALRHE